MSKNKAPEDFDGIVVNGAREHNLKNVSIKIPRNKITVFTGLSGSGKSSLAFDTVYAEGQRRYVESLSAYARNFLEQLKKPEVDSVTGLSPAIAIDQKSVGLNPRSTVGTITEIYDYLRVVYSSVGVPHCPKCGKPITRQSTEQIVQSILKLKPEDRVMILAPIALAGSMLPPRGSTTQRRPRIKLGVVDACLVLQRAFRFSQGRPSPALA